MYVKQNKKKKNGFCNKYLPVFALPYDKISACAMKHSFRNSLLLCLSFYIKLAFDDATHTIRR